jgi:malonyl-CoA/methylmalonyl-CoA synthetase
VGAEPQTLVDLFQRTLKTPDRSFITGLAGLNSYTFGQAQDASQRFAVALANLGVRHGDRVVLHAAKSSESIIVGLAVTHIGAVLVALNPGATDAELEHLINDSQPALIVTDADRGAYLTVPCTVITLSGLVEHAAQIDSEPPLAIVAAKVVAAKVVAANDVAAIVYTSGTTGRAKGAMISHRNLTSNALALAAAWGFTNDDVLLHALPMFHVHGLFVAVNTALAAGCSMRLAPKFDLELMLTELPRSTVLMGVPTFYTRLLAEPRFTRAACRTMRLFISGSAPLLATVHREFEQRTGHIILERYGMTETSMLTSNPLNGPRKPGSVGPALDGVEVRVVVEHSTAPLAPGQVGHIEVSGPNVFSGYWRRPDLRDSEFRADGFFRTGDIGVFDDDGYLNIVGRSKDLIISGGFNVYPQEIEEAINLHPGVCESAVIGIPDADFGEAVVAIVVADPSAELNVGALQESLRMRFASYKRPKQIHVVDALPRNALGKVEKARLRTTYG